MGFRKSLARIEPVNPGGIKWIASALIFLVTHLKNAKREAGNIPTSLVSGDALGTLFFSVTH